MQEQDNPNKKSLSEKTVNRQKPAAHIYGEGVRPADMWWAEERIRLGIKSEEEREQAYKALIEELNRPV